MGDIEYDVLVVFELYEDAGWMYVEFITAADDESALPNPQEEEEEDEGALYKEDETESFAHLLIPGHLFMLMSDRLPEIPESSFSTGGDVDLIDAYGPDEQPTYLLYVRDIETFRELRSIGARWSILQVVELQIVADIIETAINPVGRICDNCADPENKPVLWTCRRAVGAGSVLGCLTTQLGEGLGERFVRNVVQDMGT